MKIKKVFSLFSVCSLAVLMTACGKSSKNDGILDVDLYNMRSVTKEEYIDENKADKEIVKVFENQKINSSYSSLDNGIVTTYDDDNYYIYNLKLGGKKITELKKEDVYSISYTTSYNTAYILIRFNVDDAGKTRWVVYLPDGKCMHDSSDEYSNRPSISRAESEKEIMVDFIGKTIFYQKMVLSAYKGPEDDKQNVRTYYYAIKEEENSNYEEYLTEDEFIEKYQNYNDMKYDGALLGLKGYTLQVVTDEKVNIYNKKDEIVNIFGLEVDGIISDGHMLYQTIKQVGVNDKYDIYYSGKYLQVNTFKINVLTSKVEKVSGFHYYITGTLSPLLTKDEEGNYKELKGFFCNVYDFKEKKSVTDSDQKIALVKGNGNIEVNKSLMPTSARTVIDDGNNYYTYTSTTATGTIVNDKKGKVVGVYDGVYYDDVLVKFDGNNNATFYDKTGKKLLYLKSVTKYSLYKYVGTDLFGNTLIACIDGGELKTADLKDYNFANGFVTKMDEENVVTFYSFDNTLTKMNLEFDTDLLSFSHYRQYADYDYYCLYDSSNNYTVFYFK